MIDENGVSAKQLLDHLPNYNHTGTIFRQLVADPERPLLEPVQNINDFNRGSIFNALEWHLRYQELSSKSAILADAEDWFLEEWAKLLGIRRPQGMQDTEYKGFILGFLLSSQNSIPMVQEIFPRPDYFIFNFEYLGFCSDHSVTDLDPIPPGLTTANVSSYTTYPRGGVFVLVDDKSLISQTQIEKMKRVIVAGSGIFVGEF